MADDNIGILDAGDFITARWLNKLYWMVRRNRVQVARDSGLTMVEDPNGKVLGFTPVEKIYLGITTTTIPGRYLGGVYLDELSICLVW